MTDTARRQRRLAYLAWVAVCLIWGTTYFGIRVSLETVPPALMGGFRWTVAGALLMAGLKIRGETMPPVSRWGAIALLGFLMLVLGNGGVVLAEQWVPSGLTAVLVATSPFWMAGIDACLPGGEKLRGRVIAGLAIGFGGIVLLVWPELTVGSSGNRGFLAGIVCVQVAAFGWSLGSSYSKRRTHYDNILAITAYQMLAGGPADKITLVDRLSAAGLPVIEVSAFVSPKWVPQMGDAGEVFAGIVKRPGTRYTALVPNLAGLERARAAGVREIAIFAAASETFSRKNINQTIDGSLLAYAELCRVALTSGMRVRGYLSTVFGCPYEGAVSVERVVELTTALLQMGAFEVALSDTIGVAHPGQVRDVLGVIARRVPLDQVALHFHDTRGTALANVLTALDLGVATFDAAAGGLGGCPYAPGAAGNLATEDLIFMLDGLGVETGVSLPAVVAASAFIETRIGHALPSRYARAVRASRTAETPSTPRADRPASS